MPAGRPHKPLFEHLAKDQPSSSTPTYDAAPLSPSRRFLLSPAALYGFIAATIALLILCWAIAYRIGYNKGYDSWTTNHDNSILLPPDPLRQPDPDRTVLPARQDPAGNQALSATAILGPTGTLPNDPRRSGFNYLELATLSQSQAQAAIAYLARNNVQAIAVPIVETSRQGANNPVRYRLVSMQLPVSSSEFRTKQSEREQHEAQVKRLGTQWKNSSGGASDFSQPLWKRHP